MNEKNDAPKTEEQRLKDQNKNTPQTEDQKQAERDRQSQSEPKKTENR